MLKQKFRRDRRRAAEQNPERRQSRKVGEHERKFQPMRPSDARRLEGTEQELERIHPAPLTEAEEAWLDTQFNLDYEDDLGRSWQEEQEQELPPLDFGPDEDIYPRTDPYAVHDEAVQLCHAGVGVSELFWGSCPTMLQVLDEVCS